MKRMTSFGILVGLLLTVMLGVALDRRVAHQNRPQVDTDLLTSWREGSVSSVRTPADAKERHLFWLTYRSRRSGIAVDVLKTPRLFRALFPGYPADMAADQGLWNDYFSRSFEPNVVLSAFGDGDTPHGHSLFVANYEGCIDILRRYGADLLLLGNSILFRHVVLDLLAENLSRSKQKPRILMCAGDLGPEGVEGVLERLRNVVAKHKVRAAVLAMSPGWSADTFRAEMASAVPNSSAVERMPSALEKFRNRFRLKNHFLDWTWRKMFPVQWDDIREAAFRKVPAAASSAPVSVLFEMVARAPSEKSEVEVPAEICRQKGFRVWGERVVGTLRHLAQDVFIFRGPASDYYLSRGPECFSPSLTAALRALKGPHVEVYSGTWKEIGLTDRDFLYWTEDPNELQFDWNHTNYGFARKVTLELARWAGRIF